MRKLKFLFAALLGAIAFIASEGFLKKVLITSLCGILALNPSLCAANLAANHDAKASATSGKGSSFSNTMALPVERGSFVVSQRPGYAFSSDEERRVYEDTINGTLDKYNSISKRNSYYEHIDKVLQSCPGTKGIQFFDAAKTVTSFGGVGFLDNQKWYTALNIVHSEITRKLYNDINAKLFERNVEVVRSLLQQCKPIQPVHDDAPCFISHSATSSALDFDIAMTEFEQNLVQRQFVEPYQDDPFYKDAFQDANEDINFKGFLRTLGGEKIFARTLGKAGNWAKESLNVAALDYKSLNHRLAIAQALIYIKHDKSQADFKEHWKNQKYPDACPKQPEPTCHAGADGTKDCPSPTKEGKSYGDPHFITFDGFRYGFQTVGEFIMTRSKDGLFEVQTRQAPVNRNLSMNSAVAMKVGRDRVVFYTQDFPDQNTSDPVRVNGQSVAFENDKFNLPGGGLIVKTENNYAVSFPTGEKVFLGLESAGGRNYFNAAPFVYDRAGLYEGLLGNSNADTKDDLQIRNGQNLSATQSTYGDVKQILSGAIGLRLPGQLDVAEKIYFDQLNQEFANSWRVKPEDSLFDYASGKTTENYTDKSFPEKYLKLDMLSSQQLEQARGECRNRNLDVAQMEGCVFDVGFTGFSEFAYTTAQINSYVDTVNQLFPGLDIPQIPRPEALIDAAVDAVKPKICVPIPFVPCL